jgi:ferredoxin
LILASVFSRRGLKPVLYARGKAKGNFQMTNKKQFAAQVHQRGIQTGIQDDWSPPEDLLEVPGIKRHEYEEQFYAREYPLKNWLLNNPAFVQYMYEFGGPYIVQQYGEALKQGKNLCAESAHIPPHNTPAKKDEDLTEHIRHEALELGFTMVGFRPYDFKYTYSETKDEVIIKRNVVALGLEQPYEQTQKIPSPASEIAVFGTYVKWVDLALELANRIRSRGYRAEVQHPLNPPMMVHPYFIEAGLGQMGANGQLLSPYVGSRARLSLITTDAPVTFDEPIDYGLPKFCALCQVCVQRCPGRALTRKEINWRGVIKYKTVTSRCAPMLATFDSCGVCMAVCPIQKYGYHRVMEHYRKTGQVLGKGTHELEGYTLGEKGYYGPGELPSFKRGELASPGIEQRYGDPIPNEPY